MAAEPPLVDSQIHVWEGARPERPWLASERRAPFPEFSCERALALMDAEGIDMAILIPPIWLRFQDDYVLDCVARHPDRFAVVTWFDPAPPDLAGRLAELWARPAIVGVRFILTIAPGSDWLRDGHLAGGPLEAFWPAAEALGIPVVVRLTRTVSELAEVAESHPGLVLVVDHCAAESEPDEAAFAALPDLLELARFERICVKVSSLAKYSKLESPFPDMDPVVEATVSAFGAERCMWGSDITQYMKRLDYGPVVEHVRSGCGFLAPGERAALRGGTACRVFGLRASVDSRR